MRSSTSSSGFASLNLFCQYIYVALGKFIASRITTNLNSFLSSWITRDSIFAVVSEYLSLKLGAFLSKHSPLEVTHFPAQALVLSLIFALYSFDHYSFLT